MFGLSRGSLLPGWIACAPQGASSAFALVQPVAGSKPAVRWTADLPWDKPVATLRHPSLPDMQLALRIVDISISGCALLLPSDVPPLTPGTELNGVQLELDTDTQLAVTLRIQHASSILSSRSGLKLGCAIVRNDNNAERVLQRFIDHTQKRRRLLSLD